MLESVRHLFSGTLLMSTGVVSKSLGSTVEMNNLNTCTSAKQEARANAAALIKDLSVAEFGVPEAGVASTGGTCYYCFKKMMIFYYRQILYNMHPGTPMPNICHFSDTIISILIKSITSIFLNIFLILFLSQFHIRPPPSSTFAPVVHGPLAPAYF